MDVEESNEKQDSNKTAIPSEQTFEDKVQDVVKTELKGIYERLEILTKSLLPKNSKAPRRNGRREPVLQKGGESVKKPPRPQQNSRKGKTVMSNTRTAQRQRMGPSYLEVLQRNIPQWIYPNGFQQPLFYPPAPVFQPPTNFGKRRSKTMEANPQKRGKPPFKEKPQKTLQQKSRKVTFTSNTKSTSTTNNAKQTGNVRAQGKGQER